MQQATATLLYSTHACNGQRQKPGWYNDPRAGSFIATGKHKCARRAALCVPSSAACVALDTTHSIVLPAHPPPARRPALRHGISIHSARRLHVARCLCLRLLRHAWKRLREAAPNSGIVACAGQANWQLHQPDASHWPSCVCRGGQQGAAARVRRVGASQPHFLPRCSPPQPQRAPSLDRFPELPQICVRQALRFGQFVRLAGAEGRRWLRGACWPQFGPAAPSRCRDSAAHTAALYMAVMMIK